MQSKSIPIFTAIPYFCLFVSGLASLTYELIWIKQLTLLFGGTLYAISAVLCAFMTGLALGAWGISIILNRIKPVNLILLYGILEGLIGLYGLFFPLGLKLLGQVYPLAASLQSPLLLHLIEFVLAAGLMLPSTLLMGATLPIIGSWAIGGNRDKIFTNVSLLYSLNTFGAMCGVIFTQYYAVGHFGIRGTNFTAVGLNFIVLALCWFYPFRTTQQDSDIPVKKKRRSYEEKVPAPFLSLLLLIIFAYSGMASLSSEILWTRILVFPLGSSLYSFALILATFLFGIALGSLLAKKLLGNSRWVAKFLFIELAIGIICIAIIPAFDHLPEWITAADRMFYDLNNTAGKTLLVRSLFAFGLMFLPALGFGLIFPLANHIHFELFKTVSGTLGNSYAVNTLGAILGTVLTPFLFIPLWGIRLSLFIIYAVLILITISALAFHLQWKPRRLTASMVITLFLIIGTYAYSNPSAKAERLGKNNFARIEINTTDDRLRLLDYKEGAYATISAVEDIKSGARTIYVDGFSTATVSNSIGGSAYMQAMGFIPMVLHPNPKRALVICFGTGNTMGTVSLFPGVEVDGVEIDPNVLSFAHWFSKWNHDVLKKKNVNMIVQDGRNFIQATENKYDVITLEPMSPVQAGVTNLYSREFYESASKSLNAGGIMMQWLPLHLVGPADAKNIIKTFQEVFPHTSVWNSFLTRIVLLVGSQEPVSLDKLRFEEVKRAPALRQSAEQMGLYSFLDFMDFYLADGASIKPFVKDAKVITDDLPLLEHSHVNLLPPLKSETDETFLNLLRYRVDLAPPTKGFSQEEKDLYLREFKIRTAQRLSVFSQRYKGPGESAFKMKNYFSGLEQVKIYLEKKGENTIELEEGRWLP